MLDGVPMLLMIVISIPHTKRQYFASNQYFSDKKFQYFSSPSPQVASLSCWHCADGITMYHVEPQLLLPAVLTLHTLETLIMEKKIRSATSQTRDIEMCKKNDKIIFRTAAMSHCHRSLYYKNKIATKPIL